MILYLKLDSMRLFFHRRSPSPPDGTQWYRLLHFLHDACCIRPSYGRRPAMHCQWGRLSSFSFFLLLVTLTFDLWLWPSNSGEIFIQCT